MNLLGRRAVNRHTGYSGIITADLPSGVIIRYRTTETKDPFVPLMNEDSYPHYANFTRDWVLVKEKE